MLYINPTTTADELLATMEHLLRCDEETMARESKVMACTYIIDNHIMIDNIEYTLGFLRITGEEYKSAGGGYCID